MLMGDKYLASTVIYVKSRGASHRIHKASIDHSRDSSAHDVLFARIRASRITGINFIMEIRAVYRATRWCSEGTPHVKQPRKNHRIHPPISRASIRVVKSTRRAFFPFHTDAMITNTIARLTFATPLLLFPVAAGLTMIDRRSEEREIATSTIIMYTVRHAVIG